jgi:hypothetical protein
MYRSSQLAGRRWWPAISAAVVIALGASLLFPAGRHQWALSLIRQPARYTALGFRYAWLLPANARTDQRIPVFFTVGNQEGRTTTYRYILREIDPLGNARTLSSAVSKVPAGATWTVDTSVRPTCGLSPCEIQVALPGHPETLDFLVTLAAAARHQAKPHRAKTRGHRT